MNRAATIIGIVFMVLSMLAYVYQESQTNSYLGELVKNTDVNYPLRSYSYPTFIGGLVLLIIGLSNNSMKGGKK